MQKVVNINQSAFISSRHIQDNILIAQELLKGKKGARRCAKKINIQKAYDTVSWEFLESIMLKFGFHLVMVNWIMTCVRTSKFSVCVNGEAHGYFNGGREGKKFKFHYGCKELKLSNMCFADDLLVLCNGDVESVEVKNSMDQFSSIYRLLPNIGKSTIFFGSVPLNVQNDILGIIPFQVGCLPMKYLGILLIAMKLGINDSKSLVDKVAEKSNCWKNKEIEKMLKGFLWCQGPMTSGKAKVAWKQVCMPKDQGGLGIKSLKNWNEVLLIKRLWKIIEGKESLWVKWVNDLKGPLCDIIPRRDWYRERYSDKETVADMINNGIWIWPMHWYNKYPKLCNISIPTLSKGAKDKPRHAFVLWLAIKERLATQDILARWNYQTSDVCPLCKKEKDSHAHLFFKCEFAEQIWEKLKDKMGNVRSNNVFEIHLYYIWQERNWRIFKKEERTVEQMLKIITENVKMRLMSFKVKQTNAVIKVAES
ncbi:RNA-directed DNA polymerase, eukaryota, reverse transcriptase zinc-binding domain protein [Tanacetum coccineum]